VRYREFINCISGCIKAKAAVKEKDSEFWSELLGELTNKSAFEEASVYSSYFQNSTRSPAKN
jgi:hypothetical protein